jgi:DNA invertase Pin-like site-specific DNA recombinase
MKKIVAYYRLSRPKKGKNIQQTMEDAYGLEDQRREVQQIAARFGAVIVGEFKEIVTGTRKRPNRVQLRAAISLARLHKAVLVVGKQDRLARNLHFITGLIESGVQFMCADRPDQSVFEIQIRATVDEEEARRISDRTKRGLRVAKEQGVLLGSARPGHWDNREDRRLLGAQRGGKASAEARRQRTLEAYSFVVEVIREMRAAGMSLPAIASRLNELGHTTQSGTSYRASTIHRLLRLFAVAV